MGYSLFLMPLLVSFIISTLLLIVFILVNRRCAIRDSRITKRHLHKKGISRFGGIALIIAFVITILLDKNLVINTPLLGVLIGSGAILILGFVDDIRQLSWKTQLFFQLAIVMLVYIMGNGLAYISNPFGGVFLLSSGIGYVIGFLIAIIWVVFLMNAINWVDGVDGVSGGITFIGVVTVFILSFRPEVNQPPIAIITAALMGCFAAFLFFNFHSAKIMAGTSGSMFMGFILAILAIFAGAKIATTLLVLAVPIIDALWVITERFRAGDSIFAPDKRHLHFRLLELGWSVKKICLFYYAITVIVAVIALNTNAVGKIIGFALVALFMAAVLFVIRIKKHA